MPSPFALSLVLMLAPPAPDAGSAPATESVVVAAVDAQLAATLPKDGGGVVRVARPGHVLFEKVYGGYRLDDAIPIASGTQLLSTVVILRLVDAGKLSLDSPVSSVLGDWPADKAAITLRMLLAHTSGLAPSARCLDDRNTTLEACVREIAQTPLRRDPGTVVLYGSTGLQVAGRMAEVATGARWTDLFRDQLTRPLGMRATGFGRTANPRVAGGAQSTVGDYALALELLLGSGLHDGVRLLTAASVDAMFQDQSRGLPLLQTPYALFPGREAARPGLGLWLDRTGPGAKDVEAVCQGAFGFTAWIDRERQLEGVLLVKSDLRRIVPLEQGLRARFRSL